MKERRGGPTPHTTFRTRPDDVAIMQALQEHLGLGQTAVIRLALRRLAQQEGLALPSARPPAEDRPGHENAAA